MTQIVNSIKVYTDGACSGNPGPGSVGIVIIDENNQELATCKDCIGDTTNNKAEYRALIRGLELALGVCRRRITCFSDNELVIKQLNGQYRIKNKDLLQLCIEVKNRAQLFEQVVYQYTPRGNQFIAKADRLAKEALSGN